MQAKLPHAAAKGKEQDTRTGAERKGKGAELPEGTVKIHRSQHQDTYLKQQKHLQATFGSVP